MEDGLNGQSGANVMLIAETPETGPVTTQLHCLVVRTAAPILKRRRVHSFAMVMTVVHLHLTILDASKRKMVLTCTD